MLVCLLHSMKLLFTKPIPPNPAPSKIIPIISETLYIYLIGFQQDGGGTVAVEVVVVADGFGNGQVQHVVLCIAPVGFGQTVSGVFFFGRHFPLVLADDLAVAVVVEAGNAVAVGGADEVAVQVVLVSGFLNSVVLAGECVDQSSQYIAFELGNPQRGLAVEAV